MRKEATKVVPDCLKFDLDVEVKIKVQQITYLELRWSASQQLISFKLEVHTYVYAYVQM